MPRKAQGWITFQASDEERQILEQMCQQTQRTKTEILREMIRRVGQSSVGETTTAEESEVETEENTSPMFVLNQASTASQTVQISARNILKGKVKRLVKGTVNAEVTLTVAPGVELVAIVTRSSADKLGLKQGKAVFAVIKSSSVMIAAG